MTGFLAGIVACPGVLSRGTRTSEGNRMNFGDQGFPSPANPIRKTRKARCGMRRELKTTIGWVVKGASSRRDHPRQVAAKLINRTYFLLSQGEMERDINASDIPNELSVPGVLWVELRTVGVLEN